MAAAAALARAAARLAGPSGAGCAAYVRVTPPGHLHAEVAIAAAQALGAQQGPRAHAPAGEGAGGPDGDGPTP